MATRIEKTDLARDALYDKVNVMIDEVNTKIDNKDSLPSQTGNTGKFLTTDGTNASWGEVKQIEIKQDLTNPTIDTVPSTKAVSDESSRITTLMNTKITNCITEIPQDIKLELNNGTLTLKAGSKVYIPNGFEADESNKFDVVIIKSDITINSVGADGQCSVYYNKSEKNLAFYYKSANSSGTTPPTGDGTFYDINNNTIKRYVSGSAINQLSLPIATITDGTSAITSIDQIFNGFGYIGSTIFALPGVKGLIPNGRNEDGSLKNLLSINDSVHIYTLLSSETKENIPIYVKQNGSFFRAINHIYDEKNNFNLNFGDINYCYVGPYVSYANGKVTSFTPKTAFHALDYNDKSTISGWSMPSSRYIDLTLGASGSTYKAPANGWFTWYAHNNNNGSLFIQNNSSGPISYRTFQTAHDMSGFIPAKAGDNIYLEYYNLTFTVFRFIFAEGEN